jgi:hypothetical protein
MSDGAHRSTMKHGRGEGTPEKPPA